MYMMGNYLTIWRLILKNKVIQVELGLELGGTPREAQGYWFWHAHHECWTSCETALTDCQRNQDTPGQIHVLTNTGEPR